MVDLLFDATGIRDGLVMCFVLVPACESLVVCKSLFMTEDEFKMLFNNTDQPSAQVVVKRWKRNSDYLAALIDSNMICLTPIDLPKSHQLL